MLAWADTCLPGTVLYMHVCMPACFSGDMALCCSWCCAGWRPQDAAPLQLHTAVLLGWLQGRLCSMHRWPMCLVQPDVCAPVLCWVHHCLSSPAGVVLGTARNLWNDKCMTARLIHWDMAQSRTQFSTT